MQCSDVAGFANQVNQRIATDNELLAQLRVSLSELVGLQREANGAAAEIVLVSQRADGLLTDSHDASASALREIGELIDDVVHMGDELEGFVDAIEHVGSISGELERIARHTGMLAINASIEAARAGGESQGFAAVAIEVKRLATNARQASSSVSHSIARLERQARTVIDDMRSGAARGRAVRSRTNEISLALTSIAQLVAQFAERSAAIRSSENLVTRHVDSLGDGLEGFAATASANSQQLAEMRERLDALESASNQVLNQVAHSGVETRDRTFIDSALEQAAEVAAIVDAAMRAEQLTAAAVFDTAYRAIAESDPPQFMTDFVPFADDRIRPLLDRYTAEQPAIVGCCLIDRNGHLPTHVSARSQQPRPGERLWNLEHARNRQIFMDRQTRDALDRDGDYFLYTYRQDFGDGRYRPLRSVFVPLSFGGKRWGLYELGYLI